MIEPESFLDELGSLELDLVHLHIETELDTNDIDVFAVSISEDVVSTRNKSAPVRIKIDRTLDGGNAGLRPLSNVRYARS